LAWTRQRYRPASSRGLRQWLVEVVACLQTDPAVADRTHEFCADVLGKKVIRADDRSGFVVNAILVPYLLSAIRSLQNGVATREDIDEGMVAGCAVRQANILRVAAKLVRPGGLLGYSTCTFAPEEDEGVIADFLDQFPDYEVMELPQFHGFMTGRPDWLSADLSPDLTKAVRLFPHRIEGEGHFVCLLRRKFSEVAERVRDTQLSQLSKHQSVFWQDFCSKVICID